MRIVLCLFHEFACLVCVLIGSQVKSSYDADERPTAAFEFSGFVSVESKFRYFPSVLFET